MVASEQHRPPPPAAISYTESQREVMLRLMHLEEQLTLFDRQIAGTYFWEYARLPVYFRIVNALNVLAVDANRMPWTVRDLAYVASSAAWGAVCRNPLLARRRPLLVVGYPRRRLAEDGTWQDIQFDPWLSQLDVPFLYLRMLHRRRHYRPIPTANACHHDVLDLLGALTQCWKPLRFSSADKLCLQEISSEIECHFGVRLDLAPVVRSLLARRRGLLPWYRALLKRLRPKLVIVTSPNCPQMALIEACKTEGIHTAEIQHGLFGPCDPSYTFPNDAGRVRYLADDFLIYGQYWQEILGALPRTTNLQIVGYPWFDVERRRREQGARRDKIIFLSQGTIGRELSRFAVELSQNPRYHGRIVYRLHPDELHWRRHYPWLVGSAIEVDDGTKESLYTVLNRAEIQVGVYSTAILEGLALGVRTALVDLPGIDMMEYLIDRGWVSVVRHPRELGDSPPIARNVGQHIFQPNGIEALKEYVGRRI